MPSILPKQTNEIFCLNTQYMSCSNIIFTLKMEYVSKNTIFGLKMMVIFVTEFVIHFYEVRENSFPHEGISN